MDEKTSKLELLYDGAYYDVTNWIKKHPGGKIINLYVKTGEDSTIAVQQFHQRSIKKVMAIMRSLPHRKIKKDDDTCKDLIRDEKYKALTKDYIKLYDTFQEEGLFKPSPWHVFSRILEIALFSLFGLYCFESHRLDPNLMHRIVGIFCITVACGRAGWVGHEGGHHSLLGIPNIDRLLSSFFLGLFGGSSSAYWINQHSRHHAMPQHVKHDVDLKTLPLLAFNKRIVGNRQDGKGFFVQNQKWLFFLCDATLVILVWQLFLHPRYCIRTRNYRDLFFMCVYHIILMRIGFSNGMLIVWLTSNYFFGNFSLSHSHLPVTNEPTHWVEYSLTHTANVRSSTFGWVDYWMGNLNYQIEHHLFPTMPQYKNKLCRDRVKALAKKHNLPYNLFSYTEAVKMSLNNLETVSHELAVN